LVDSSILQKKQAVIVVPHEDDLEILCFNAAYDLIRSGYHVTEILMTDGRFGSKNLDINGDRLMRIRKPEALNAAKAYGYNSQGNQNVTVEFMKYCDGFVPFTRYSINELKNKILSFKPEICVGPDPFYAIDWHHDHVAVGRNYFFALKSMSQIERPPKAFFFQSFRNNTYIPLGSYKTQYQALKCYKSQLSPIYARLLTAAYKHFFRFRAFTSYGRPAGGYRRVRFETKYNSYSSLKTRLWLSLFFQTVKFSTIMYDTQYLPLPKIGYQPGEIPPERFDSMIAKKLANYYFGEKYVSQNPKVLKYIQLRGKLRRFF
jgi:LmbE family N-acetylglucosaminyl deacetylase